MEFFVCVCVFFKDNPSPWDQIFLGWSAGLWCLRARISSAADPESPSPRRRCFLEPQLHFQASVEHPTWALPSIFPSLLMAFDHSLGTQAPLGTQSSSPSPPPSPQGSPRCLRNPCPLYLCCLHPGKSLHCCCNSFRTHRPLTICFSFSESPSVPRLFPFLLP